MSKKGPNPHINPYYIITPAITACLGWSLETAAEQHAKLVALNKSACRISMNTTVEASSKCCIGGAMVGLGLEAYRSYKSSDPNQKVAPSAPEMDRDEKGKYKAG